MQPLVLQRANRWNKQAGARASHLDKEVEHFGASEEVNADGEQRWAAAVTAIQVLLPERSEDLIRQALAEHDGDTDAALEALLGDSDAASTTLTCQVEELADLATPPVAALAPSAPLPEPSSKPTPPLPPHTPAPKTQPTLVDRPPAPTPAQVKDDEGPPSAPPWLPMLHSGTPKPLYQIQTERLKAALGPSPANRSAGHSLQEVNNRGNMRAGGG
mmetsp:Transcript_30451/g.87333  ORF Transcript_30451/g.87333 Transcript_30451/m.87333 type:complete len:216 (+) Transcript_30451:80-727(+)